MATTATEQSLEQTSKNVESDQSLVGTLAVEAIGSF
jgi:hypothetical protein